MATRMTSLLYGDRPEADVEPGNRVDTALDWPAAASPPTWTTSEMPESDEHHEVYALRGLVLGLAAAAAVLAAVTIVVVALMWWHTTR
jgi:hypothetical protein